jgi:glycosyltransferase involved in cell wall biosynthesis
MRRLSRWLYGHVADTAGTRWIVENRSDIAEAGVARAAREGRLAVVGGAGVDPDVYTPSPMPVRPPLRVALVARMIWSKGVDLAIEAVERARGMGAAVELTLAGVPDAANPRSLTATEIAALARRPGINWEGRVDDVPGLWRSHHLALLPSRGGEGVPRSLIEAAACGRPVLTTAVPGCEELARDTGGWVVPADDAGALAAALVAIAAEPELARRDDVARAAVVARYSEAAVWAETRRIYLDLAQQPAG